MRSIQRRPHTLSFREHLGAMHDREAADNLRPEEPVADYAIMSSLLYAAHRTVEVVSLEPVFIFFLAAVVAAERRGVSRENFLKAG